EGDGHLRRAAGAMRAVALTVSAALALSACGGASATRTNAQAAAPANDPAAEAQAAKAFAADEVRTLDELAVSDPRFALRVGRSPSDASMRRAAVNALLAEDPDAMAHDGALDFFSFAARARGVDRAAAIARA